MKFGPQVFVLCFVVLWASSAVFAKSWNGIEPLKSTRSEVIGILGTPVRTDEHLRAVFDTAEYTVHISWTRSNCFAAANFIAEGKADESSLVYQITLDPKTKRSSSDYVDLKVFTESPTQTPEDSSKRQNLKTVYTHWLEVDVDCFGKSCSFSNGKYGLGYSESPERGVFGIYYLPTQADFEDFKQNHKLCNAD